MKKFGLLFLVLITTLITSACWLTGCNTTDPPLELELKLELGDVSCTEAWITLTAENFQPPADLNLTTTDPDGNLKSQILNLKSKD